MAQRSRYSIFKGTSASTSGNRGTLVLSANGILFTPDNGDKQLFLPLEKISAVSIEGKLLKKLCIVDNSGKRILFSVPDLEDWRQTTEMAIRIYEALSGNMPQNSATNNIPIQPQAKHNPVSQSLTTSPAGSPGNPMAMASGGAGMAVSTPNLQATARKSHPINRTPPPVYNGQWPSGQDYEQSFQTLKLSLNQSLGQVDRWEAIRNQKNPSWYVYASGNYGSIYKVKADDGKYYAIKCFTKKSLTINQRYSLISDFLLNLGSSIPYLIHFSYFPEGIKTRKIPDVYFPVLKMEWIDGVTLNQYISTHIDDSRAIRSLGNRIADAVAKLQAVGIAHGDLSGDNIIIDNKGNVRFVDYDGMYIPDFKGQKATELGHADFQHPARNADTYSERLDSFSALVIQLSLQSIGLKPDLWKKFNGNDPDCLILRKSDFLRPNESEAIDAIGKIRSKHTRKLLDLLIQSLSRGPLWDGIDPASLVI